jgi:hypothetical protein
MRIHPKSDFETPVNYRLAPTGEPGGGRPGMPSFSPDPAEGEDLPYKVELWDEKKNSVEVLLAVTVSPSIGYAAYFAATREYPNRYVTLRHKSNVVSRWNGPGH